jgi:hypothetical protein
MNEIVSNISSNDEHPMPIVEKLWEMSEELLAASGAFQRVYGLFNVVQLCEEGWLGCPESCVSLTLMKPHSHGTRGLCV